MGNIKIHNSEIVFRIDINFEGCEVDMVYKEMMAAGVMALVPSILCDSAQIPIDKSKLKYTPTEASVEFCLRWLAGYVDRVNMEMQDSKWNTDFSKKPIIEHTKDGMAYTTWPKVVTELEEIGVEVINWYGLMMGCCHLNCSVPPEKFSMDLVDKSNKIAKSVFDKYCLFYDTKNEHLEE